jgi:hypothetical protein
LKAFAFLASRRIASVASARAVVVVLSHVGMPTMDVQLSPLSRFRAALGDLSARKDATVGLALLASLEVDRAG